ncbi:hypothetical protein [Saccharopolyspora taberi]|uniref:hypothetical protein n=1 Tax=Saccharopolyspora taberi TaxID=60895 RepID=UPI0031DB1EEF
MESLRIAHCEMPTSEDDVVQAWCWLRFRPADVEETTDPTNPLAPGKARPCSPCGACLLRLMAAAAAENKNVQPAISAEDPQMAVLVRKAQWLLDDAASYLPLGRGTARDRDVLVTTLDELVTRVREGGRPGLPNGQAVG